MKPICKIQPWKVLTENTLPAGKYRKAKDIGFELPNGKNDVFTVFHHQEPVVCVLAVTTENKIILARQFRPGPNKVLDELPGGAVDKGETSLIAVERELLEETGYKAGKIESLGFPLECAYSDIKREAFLATGCIKVSEPDTDETEFIEPITKSMEDFIQQLVVGDLTDPEVGWMGLYRLGIIKKK